MKLYELFDINTESNPLLFKLLLEIYKLEWLPQKYETKEWFSILETAEIKEGKYIIKSKDSMDVRVRKLVFQPTDMNINYDLGESESRNELKQKALQHYRCYICLNVIEAKELI